MQNSDVFEWACTQLEAATSLDRLEARGTFRLALRASGLDAVNVTREQMQTVIQRVLPGELTARGVEDAAAVCAKMASELPRAASEDDIGGDDSPESIFERLGRV